MRNVKNFPCSGDRASPEKKAKNRLLSIFHIDVGLDNREKEGRGGLRSRLNLEVQRVQRDHEGSVKCVRTHTIHVPLGSKWSLEGIHPLQKGAYLRAMGEILLRKSVCFG